MKLNGWQRLWMVGAVLWMCPVMVVSYVSWSRHTMPTVGEIVGGRDEFTVPEGVTLVTPPTGAFISSDPNAAQQDIDPLPPGFTAPPGASPGCAAQER